jgi:hypothetical protein
MIKILLPVVAVFLALGCILLNDRGFESLEEPAVVVAVLFIVLAGCFPLFRRAIFATDERSGASKARPWLAKFPWLPLLLTWNSVGALCALYGILSVQFPIRTPDVPDWCKALFFWLWFLPMPFATLGSTILLWRDRGTLLSRLLLLHSFVLFALWSGLVAMFVACMVSLK